MILTQASIAGFRNLSNLSFEPSPTFNLFLGPNGAGKTSILEALHLLSTGHSFRSRKTRELIQRDSDQLSISALLFDEKSSNEHRAGISKSLSGDTILRLDYEPLQSMATMTRLLPVKALSPDSHQLIQEGPAGRRMFLDWGLFHVEQQFFTWWKQYKRTLEQRNRALRMQLTSNEISAWSHELITTGQKLSESRLQYVEALKPELASFLKEFGLQREITLRYRTGWAKDLDFEEALAKSIEQCQRFKTTTVGPHRAELIIEVDQIPVKQELSRGQQKLLVYALHFAQLALFTRELKNKAIVLCDDLGAELDSHHSGRLLKTLQSMELQTFITSNSMLEFPENTAKKAFHVEHGEVVKVV